MKTLVLNQLTLFGDGSIGFHTYGNPLWDQTKDEVFALYSHCHLRKYLFAKRIQVLLCPRTQSLAHHDFQAYYLDVNLAAIDPNFSFEFIHNFMMNELRENIVQSI